MTHSSNHRSRRGFAIPTPLLYGLGAAAVLGLGYLAYKHFSKPKAQPYAQGYYQQQGGYGYQQQQGGYLPPAPPKGGYRYAYAPAAPSTSEGARAGAEDPELNRLFAESQAAHSALVAASASGDTSAADAARARYDRAKSALAAKKASMY